MSKQISKEILISVDEFEIRAAILEDRRLVEYYVEETDKRRIVGNIYLGRVKDILPGMESAFVDIGLERNAFLFITEVLNPDVNYDDAKNTPKIQNLLMENQELLVQVTREAVGKKGARLTAQLALPGRKIVLVPYGRSLGVSKRLEQEERERLHALCKPLKPKDVGLIIRTAAEGATEEELRSDLEYLQKLWHAISKRAEKTSPPAMVYNELDLANRIIRDVFTEDFDRLIVDSEEKYQDMELLLDKTTPELKSKVSYYKDKAPLFEKYDIDNQLKTALDRQVWLRSGGYIAIDRTEALTSIDVNTAKNIGSRSLEQTVLKNNLEAADEIVRQLRLRDIGGIIVIDFIDMQNQTHRNAVFNAFSEALTADRTKSRVIEISKLGLVEMTRKSLSKGLQAHYYDRCPVCHGTGQVISSHQAGMAVVREIEVTAKESSSQALAFELSPQVMEHIETNGDKKLIDLDKLTGKHIFTISNPKIGLQEASLVKEGSLSELQLYIEERRRQVI